MKTAFSCLVLILFGSVFQSRSAMADVERNQLVGTWQVTSFSVLTVETNEVSRPHGDEPIGYLQYSPGGHIVVYLSSGTYHKTPSGTYTEAEQIAIYNGIFGAYAGTYDVEGNKVTHHVIAAWSPNWIGTDQVRYVELDGDKLSIKTAPLIFARNGKMIVGILTFRRIE